MMPAFRETERTGRLHLLWALVLALLAACSGRVSEDTYRVFASGAPPAVAGAHPAAAPASPRQGH